MFGKKNKVGKSVQIIILLVFTCKLNRSQALQGTIIYFQRYRNSHSLFSILMNWFGLQTVHGDVLIILLRFHFSKSSFITHASSQKTATRMIMYCIFMNQKLIPYLNVRNGLDTSLHPFILLQLCSVLLLDLFQCSYKKSSK